MVNSDDFGDEGGASDALTLRMIEGVFVCEEMLVLDGDEGNNDVLLNMIRMLITSIIDVSGGTIHFTGWI